MAWIVEVGLTPPEVTQMLPSTMKRFFTSWQRPHSLTTERAGFRPMRAVPSRWPGLLRSAREHPIYFAPAVAKPVATDCAKKVPTPTGEAPLLLARYFFVKS